MQNTSRRNNQRRRRIGTTSRRPTFPATNQIPSYRERCVGSYADIGAPDSHRVTLKYSDDYTLTTASAVQLWSLNGLFKPDQTGTGHQPNFFAEWAAIYEKYLVESVSVTLDVSGQTPTNPLSFAFAANENNGSAQNVDQTSQTKFSRYGIIPANGSQTKRIKFRVSAAQIYGEPNYLLNADVNIYSDIGSNPVDQAFMWLTIKGAAPLATLQVHAVIEYNVKFKGVMTVTP